MKFIVALGISWFLLISPLCAQTQYNSEVLSKAIEEKDQAAMVSIFKEVAAKPDYIDSINMFILANIFLGLKDLETASFLFFAAQMRAQVDLQHYKPVDKGGDSPAVALGAMRQQLGSVINTNLVKYPKAYENVIERLDKWSPVYEGDYAPGWEAESKPEIEDLKSAIIKVKTTRLDPMRQISQLLNTKEYFDAFLIIQEQNLLPSKDQDEEAKQLAIDKMDNIEQELNLTGFIAMLKKNK